MSKSPFFPSPILTNTSHQDFLATFETNTFGPIKVTRAILPHFRQRKSGVMVFVSSLSGWVGHGYTGAYAASKFALEGESHAKHLVANRR